MNEKIKIKNIKPLYEENFNEFFEEVFFQQELHVIKQENGETIIELDTNYKYCKGVIFSTEEGVYTDTKIGLMQFGHYVLNPLPKEFLLAPHSYFYEKQIFDLNIPAAGNTITVTYQGAAELEQRDLTVIFILTNKKPKPINYNYDYVALTSIDSDITTSIYLNNNVKCISEIGFNRFMYGNYSAPGRFTLSTSIKTLFNSEDDTIEAIFPSWEYLPVRERLIKLYLPVNIKLYLRVVGIVTDQSFLFVYKYIEK